MSSAIKFPCKICENNVTNSDQAIQCDLCDSWVHIKCNDLDFIDNNSSKILMILGFVSHAVAKFSHSVLWKIKTLSLISMIVTNLKTLLTKIALYY